MDNLKKEMSRDELGKVLIDLAKDEIEKNADIPSLDVLSPIFDDKFGEMIKGLSLFDLGILIRRTEVITEAAEKKQINNIVRLTKAFDSYLRTKRDEKDKKTQEFLAKKLQQIAA